MSETFVLRVNKPKQEEFKPKEEPDDIRSLLYTAFVEIPYLLIWGDDNEVEVDLEDMENARKMLMYGVSQYTL
ncbi:hypothetical protein HK103_005089 [Boothiomyces macroporosus]|uniref:Uncharacterized protein n=1 Tax=Boothiomyces macroporosus TaxID=261099 RepID=A0AAD5Y800_9FUNG|nr:hypothetical protein HK103_005089 [Boothiomyces macroporosus]